MEKLGIQRDLHHLYLFLPFSLGVVFEAPIFVVLREDFTFQLLISLSPTAKPPDVALEHQGASHSGFLGRFLGGFAIGWLGLVLIGIGTG